LKLELLYFNGTGRAEQVRLVFVYAEQDFIDTRLEGMKFAEMKQKGELTFGSLPVLKDGDNMLG
jgi:hypothetical protein